MEITKEIADRFDDFIFNWDYKTYVVLGGYGSGKSYHTACKIIFKCLEEKRKVLVVREVYETIKDSCYDLINEILEEMDLLASDESSYRAAKAAGKVYPLKSPMEFKFPNGSRIIFKGMDKPQKVKSLNGVSIIWLEEASEIKYEGYKELLGRIRTLNASIHFILTFNPVGKENWVYKHFFRKIEDDGEEHIILDDERLYKKRTIVKNNVYYHHSTCDDNPWLPKDYIKTLDDMRTYDEPLWRVARWGRFGANGLKVLPQFKVAYNPKKFKNTILSIPQRFHFYGFDFGFEESYNAVLSMAVDDKKKILYIYDEIYVNHITDDVMAERKDMQKLKAKQEAAKAGNVYMNPIVADNEDPKAIAYYRKMGYNIRACRNKFAGSRLSNTRKMKRFRRIICSPKCKNTIRELSDLIYAKKPNGELKYDEFNIDPHTFSAMWYALDTYTVADVKDRKSNSKAG